MQFVKDQAPDLILMDELTEDEIYKHLSNRLENSKIYTYIGDVVISVNPYTQISGMYGEDVIAKYDGSYAYQNEPHVYSLAEGMYRELRSTGQDQVVLISGESGAGKTEAAKKVLEYVAAVSPSGGEVDRIKKQLLASNPVLEAFGNAKTLRNDNSSRFGKYMELLFDYGGAPRGGKITSFLLEKVRVTERSVGERSFHIFYFMLAGLSAAQLKALTLKDDPAAYKFLNKSQTYTLDGMNDKTEFRRVTDAMSNLNMPQDKQESVWRVLAAILKLGNLEFKPPQGKDGKDSCAIANPAVIGGVAKLLGIKPKALDDALVSRQIRTGMGPSAKTIRTPLNVKNAYLSRDAFCKGLYSGLFDWVIQELNKTLAPQGVASDTNMRKIAILDIFGFEIFDDNSLEQLFINWCNEKLQQYFIELTLKKEQEEYEREGIEWTPIQYFNNQVILDLIEKSRPAGILAILNEDSLIQRSTDLSFLDKLNKAVGKHAHYKSAATERGKKGAVKLDREQFTLVHYAGDVTYKVDGFLDKNRDILFNSQVELIKGSPDPVVKQLFQNQATDSMKRPDSAGTRFKASLAELIATLSLSTPSYVRCLKPNERKAALSCDEERFRHQVRYLGLLENVRVRRAGFCNRQTYDSFLARYKVTCPDTWPQWRGAPRKGTTTILRHFQLDADAFREGKTKIFLRNPKDLFALEDARKAMLPTVATMIQSRVRTFVQRRKYQRERAARICQTRVRRKKGKSWILKVISTFRGNAGRENNYGLDLAWPTPPSALQAALGYLQRIQRTYRGTDIIRQIPEDQRPLMRQKVHAYDVFHGHKPWAPQALFRSNYMEREPRMQATLGNLFNQYQGNNTVLYTDMIEKMQPNGKMAPRILILTNQMIFKLDPKSMKPKMGISLAEVTNITMSSKSDSLVIIKNDLNRDHVLNFRRDLSAVQPRPNERYSEFITCLLVALKALSKEPPVEFAEHATINHAKKPGQKKLATVTWVPGGDTVWNPKARSASYQN